MAKAHSKMPIPVGDHPCRRRWNHKGPCSYKGFFTAENGVRVCMDVAWTSPAQMEKKKKDALQYAAILDSFRGRRRRLSRKQSRRSKRGDMKRKEIEAKYRPPPPESLVGALHDTVHKDIGKSRPAKSVKVKGRLGSR